MRENKLELNLILLILGDASSTGRTWQKPNGIITAGITSAIHSNGTDSPKGQRK